MVGIFDFVLLVVQVISVHAKPLQRSKKPRTFHGLDGSDFDL